MESMSINPAAGAIGLQLVDIASRGLGSGATASMSLTGLAPAGADEVSMQAAMAFAAEGAAMLALNTAAHEELARAGMALTDIVRMYSEVAGAAAATLMSGGGQFASHAFAGGMGASVGAGLMRAETLPGAGGSAARTPLMANLIDGVAASNPSTTVPAAANAASTALGAATAPLSSIGSIGQGASAGGAAGPGLASSVDQDQDENDRDNSGDQKPGERCCR
jgi:PE family protein